MKRKLTEDEIKARRDAADGYWETIQTLEEETGDLDRKKKVTKAQIKEANRNFSTLMREIIEGEVELDPQGKLL